VEDVTRVICQKLRAPAAREVAGGDPMGSDEPTATAGAGSSGSAGAHVSGGEDGSGGGSGGDGGGRAEDGSDRDGGDYGGGGSARGSGSGGAGAEKDTGRTAAETKAAGKPKIEPGKTAAEREEEARDRDRVKIRDMTAELKELRVGHKGLVCQM